MEGCILLVDKPSGWTSHDVIAKLRGIFHIRRIGHAGTLDPFATGLLIIGVGSATKKLTALVGLDKTYTATAYLGATSTTFDPEGVITPTKYIRQPMPNDVTAALKKFQKGYEQKAPLYSAKKIAGKKLYELARKGMATEEMRPSKFITISMLQATSYVWPFLTFEVSCSSGTYIRSLADDIGRTLGCGAYLTQLRRISIGNYGIKEAKTIDQLTETSAHLQSS